MHRDQLPIVRPCPLTREDVGLDGVRTHCAHCDTEVVDLSKLTERQARRQMRGCVAYETDPTGQIRFRPSRRQALIGMAALLLPVGARAAVATDEPAFVGRLRRLYRELFGVKMLRPAPLPVPEVPEPESFELPPSDRAAIAEMMGDDTRELLMMMGYVSD